MNFRATRLTASVIETVADRANAGCHRGLSLPRAATPDPPPGPGQPRSVEELLLRLQREPGGQLAAALLRLRLLSVPREEALRRTAEEWRKRSELRGRLLEGLLYPEGVALFLGAALLALPAVTGTGAQSFPPALIPLAIASFALAAAAPLLPRLLASSSNRLTKAVLLDLLLEGIRLSGSLPGAIHRCRNALKESGSSEAALRRCEASLLEGADLTRALTTLAPPLREDEIALLASNADRRRAERALLALQREEQQRRNGRERHLRELLPAAFLLVLGALLLTAAVTVVLPYMDRFLHLT